MRAHLINNLNHVNNPNLHIGMIDYFNSDILIICQKKKSYCEQNIFGVQSVCTLCKHKSKLLIQKINKIKKIIVIADEKPKKNYLIDRSTEKSIMLSIESTLASYFFTSNLDKIKPNLFKIKNQLFKDAINYYFSFLSILDENNIKSIVVYNGRYIIGKALIEAAKKLRIDYYVFDQKLSNSIIYFKNNLIHNISEKNKIAYDFYKANKIKADKLANEIYKNKQLGVSTYERSYIKDQKQGLFLKYFAKKIVNKKIIAIFPSTDHEFFYLSDAWSGLVNQCNEIDQLSKKFIDSKDLIFIVRMHPNMASSAFFDLKSYSSLKNNRNVFVLMPNSKFSTYEILNESYLSIFFCSSLACEAVIANRNCITIGPSSFLDLKVCKNFSSFEDVNPYLNYKDYLNFDGASAFYYYLSVFNMYKGQRIKWDSKKDYY